MKQTTQRFILLALMALLALFAGCKGESPTAPPPITGTSGNGNGSGSNGGTPPPTGASIALTVSTSTPSTGSISTITATVTQNNAPVPNGTAVEFSTTTPNANFTDTSDNQTTLIRTTTNGVAKATVTSSTAGPVVVNVTVNNVTKSVTINFQDPIIPPPPTSTSPTITSISPATGLPTGNQTVVITGTNFRVPVRVLFDPGNGQAPKEGFVTNVTPTQLTVTTPAFDLGVAQQIVANVTVIVEAGTPTEQRVTKSSAFTITAPVLTPVIRSLSPTSGPTEGGTRVVITGDAFEAPAQVFFGSAQAQVLNVQFHTIEVITPSAADTNPNGSGTVVGPVNVRVLNTNSGKDTVATGAFRYVAKMQITAISPTFGSALGGTDILINGKGFTSPVTVDVAGVRASVINVTGTEVLVRTAPTGTPCSNTTGPVIVTNVDNGDFDQSKTSFSYIGVPAVITGVSGSSPTVGSALTVNVLNPGVGILGTAIVSFNVGDRSAAVTPQSISNGTGTQPFTVVVPAGLSFPTVACTSSGGLAGTQLGSAPFSVTFTNVTTGCTSTQANAITIAPPGPNPCVVPPTASVTSPPASCPTPNLSPATVVAAGGATQTATITITNNGSQTLNLGAPTVTPTNSVTGISPNTSTTLGPGATGNFTVTVDPTAAGPTGATITIPTNDPSKPTLTITVCGGAT